MVHGEQNPLDIDIKTNSDGKLTGHIDTQVGTVNVDGVEPSRPQLFVRPPFFPRLRGVPFPRFPLLSEIIMQAWDGGDE